MDFWSVFKIASIGLLILNFDKINYYRLGYNAIKLCKSFKNKKKEKLEEEFVQKLIFVKDGDELIVFDCLNNQLAKNCFNEEIFDISGINYDFIIFNDNNNFIRINKFPDYINIKKNGYNVKRKLFLSLKLIHEDFSEKIDINLREPNFFIVENILLDDKVIKWYGQHFLNIDIDTNKDYHFIIIDYNIKEYKLNKSTYIKITDNYFDIVEDSEIITLY
jgi:hypothetical protein